MSRVLMPFLLVFILSLSLSMVANANCIYDFNSDGICEMPYGEPSTTGVMSYEYAGPEERLTPDMACNCYDGSTSCSYSYSESRTETRSNSWSFSATGVSSSSAYGAIKASIGYTSSTSVIVGSTYTVTDYGRPGYVYYWAFYPYLTWYVGAYNDEFFQMEETWTSVGFHDFGSWDATLNVGYGLVSLVEK